MLGVGPLATFLVIGIVLLISGIKILLVIFKDFVNVIDIEIKATSENFAD